jgi:hypothetical protein
LNGRKADLYGGIVRRGAHTFKPINMLRLEKQYPNLSAGFGR